MSERAPSEQKERLERFEFAARSLPSENHPSRNEDSYIAEPALGLAGVFDGVGGHSGGQEASRKAAQVVHETVESWDVIADDEADEMIPTSLKYALQNADDAVVSLREQQLQAPGTTASVVKLYEFADGHRVAYIASAGDSRVYIFRSTQGILEQVTADDDILSDPHERQQLGEDYHRDLTDREVAKIRATIDAYDEDAPPLDGLELHLFKMRNVFVSSLGFQGQLHIKTYRIPLESGDMVVLTSDGIHDNLTSKKMQDILVHAATPDEGVAQLTHEAYAYAQANDHGSRRKGPVRRAKKDDMTAVAVKAL
jgi:serine/threonine protein phosphatase PrpC